jgi:pimeloyl-ACP methyl ester carboxylesterase
MDAPAAAGATCQKVQGTGPPVILIHGVGLDLGMWDAQATALAPRCRVIRYDMIGHGGSAVRPGALALDDFVAQLDGLCRDLGLDRVSLVGFSMGALVAQAYALAQPERVARLVVMSGIYDRDPAARAALRGRWQEASRHGPKALIEAALVRWFSPQYRAQNPGAVMAIRRRLERNDRHGFLAAYRVFAEADAALAGRLGAIACPTLVMTGALDPGSTPEMARAMAAAIAGARLEVLPGARHLMPVEAAQAVSAALLAFLDGTDRGCRPHP